MSATAMSEASAAPTSSTSSRATPPASEPAPEETQNIKSEAPASLPRAQQQGAGKRKTPEMNELDLVFLLDVTGSMHPYLTSAQQNINNIVERIVASEGADLRVALVAYRDHAPMSKTFATKVFDFTSSIRDLRANVNSLGVASGGDIPECVTAALDDALKLPYRKEATKVVVLIGDAPPHGLGERGDYFPNGDPLGRDPLDIARKMLQQGIVIYSVGCEPGLSDYTVYGRDFFASVAEITKGKFLPLTSAKLLADVIVGGASEELEVSLRHLKDMVKDENARVRMTAAVMHNRALTTRKSRMVSLRNLEQLIKEEEARVRRVASVKHGRALNDEEVIDAVSTSLKSKGVRTSKVQFDDVYGNWDRRKASAKLGEVQVDDVYGNWDRRNVSSMVSSSSMNEARSSMRPIRHASASHSSILQAYPSARDIASRGAVGGSSPTKESANRYPLDGAEKSYHQLGDSKWWLVQDPAVDRHYFLNSWTHETSWKLPPYDIKPNVHASDRVAPPPHQHPKHDGDDQSGDKRDQVSRRLSASHKIGQSDWWLVEDPDVDRPYFYNSRTKASSWKFPAYDIEPKANAQGVFPPHQHPKRGGVGDRSDDKRDSAYRNSGMHAMSAPAVQQRVSSINSTVDRDQVSRVFYRQMSRTG